MPCWTELPHRRLFLVAEMQRLALGSCAGENCQPSLARKLMCRILAELPSYSRFAEVESLPPQGVGTRFVRHLVFAVEKVPRLYL